MSINELIGLKSKMYSLIGVDDEEVTKAKKLNKNKRHKEFVDVLLNKKVVRHNMKNFYFDDKRHVLDNPINSLAYFHKY